MSNEEIVFLCQRNETAIDACEEIVQTAFEWFMDDDGWADDMTIVVVKIKWPVDPKDPSVKCGAHRNSIMTKKGGLSTRTAEKVHGCTHQ